MCSLLTWFLCLLISFSSIRYTCLHFTYYVLLIHLMYAHAHIDTSEFSLSLSPSPFLSLSTFHLSLSSPPSLPSLTPRIYVAYVTFYLLSLIMSMQVPFVGFQPIRTSEHMAAAGVFALLNAYGLLKYLQARLTGKQFRKLFFAAIVSSAGLVFVAVVLLTYLEYVAPWSGRLYSLHDAG